MKISLGWRENEETETAIVCQWMECTQLQFLQKSSQLQTLTFNTGKDIGYIALPRLHFCSVETGNPWSVLKSRRLNECKSLKLQGHRLFHRGSQHNKVQAAKRTVKDSTRAWQHHSYLRLKKDRSALRLGGFKHYHLLFCNLYHLQNVDEHAQNNWKRESVEMNHEGFGRHS